MGHRNPFGLPHNAAEARQVEAEMEFANVTATAVGDSDMEQEDTGPEVSIGASSTVKVAKEL